MAEPGECRHSGRERNPRRLPSCGSWVSPIALLLDGRLFSTHHLSELNRFFSASQGRNWAMTIAFDTLKFADRLAAGGFTGEQAKTAASALSDTFAESVATKADLDHAVARLTDHLDRAVERLTHAIDDSRTHADRAIENSRTHTDHSIDSLRTHTDRAIDNLRTHTDRAIERLDAKIERLDAKVDASELRMTVKVGAMLVVMAGAIGVLFKLLH